MKFCWNLLPAACLVRSGVFSRGRKVSFSGEFDMASVQIPTDSANCSVSFCAVAARYADMEGRRDLKVDIRL